MDKERNIITGSGIGGLALKTKIAAPLLRYKYAKKYQLDATMAIRYHRKIDLLGSILL